MKQRLLLFLTCVLTLFGVAKADVEFTFSSANSHTKDGYTVSFAKGSGGNEPYWSGSELRLYTSNTITVTGANLKKIELNFNKQSSKEYVSTLNASTGNVVSGGASTSNSDKKTDIWTGSTESVTFTLSGSGQRVLNSVTIITDDSQGGGSTDPDPNPGGDDGNKVTFDFQTKSYGMPSNNSTYVSVPYSFSEDLVTMNLTGNSSSWRYYSNALRAYNSKNAKFTISVPSEYYIKQIDWTGKSVTFALDGTTQNITSWTGSGKENSVTFAYTSTGNNDLYNVTVQYELKPTGPQPWESTFAESYEVAKDHEVVLFGTAVEHPEMTFSTSSNDGGAIEIKNVDNQVIVKGVTAGTVNVTAKWSKSDKWTEGYTSFTVNVQNVEAPTVITFDPASGSDIMAGDLITISANGAPSPEITYCLDNINGTYQIYNEPISINEDGDHTLYVKAKNTEGEITGVATYSVTKPKIPGVGDEFELINSTDELEAGKYYVIAFTYDGTTYTMGERTSGNIPAISKDISLNGDILTIASATITLQLEETGKGYKWKACNEKNSGTYLNWGSSGTDTELNNNGAETTISFDGNSVKITNGSRWIMGRPSSNDFRVYSQNQSDALMPNLYKLVEPKAPALPVVTIDEETLENNGSKTVLKGTRVHYSCEEATITATFNGKTITENPFSIEESGKLVVYGTNEVGDGPVFTYTFTVDVKNDFQGVGANFRQVLNNSNYRDNLEEGYYVIGRYFNSESNPVKVAMSVIEGNNNITATEKVKFTKLNSSVYGPSDCEALTPTDEDVLIVYLEKNDQDQWGIKTVNYGDGFKSSQKYLCAPFKDGSTSLSFADEFTPAYIDITVQNNANISFYIYNQAEGEKLRTIGTPQSGAYFNYQTSGNAVQLYKYFDQQIFNLEVKDIKLRLTENETSTLPTFENAPELSYSIAQEGDIISISDGEITAMNPGEAVVTVSWNESDDWFAGSTSFNVKVLPRMVDITETFGFRYAKIRGKKDVGVVSQAVYYEGDGKVEYSIWEYKFADPADETLISTNDVTIQEDGMIRPEDIKNAVLNKVYTVKAIVAATDLYSAGEASYTFVIEAPVEASKGEMVEDLTDNNSNRWKDAEGNNYQLTGSYVDGAFKLTSNNTNIEYTIYKGCYQNKFFQLAKDPLGYISFTIPSNCKTITIGWGENSSSKTPGSLTVSIEGKDDETFEFFEDKSIDVRSKGGSTMTIKNADSNYVIRMSNLIFEIPESDIPEAGLYFDVSGEDVEHYINVFEDETIELPDLIGAEGMDFKDLIFDIDEIDEADDAETYQGYTITAKDFGDISIDINYPGVYTFRAEYNAAKLVEQGKLAKVEDAKFLDGFAILRINVFPRLTVVPSDNHDSTLADDERTNAPELTLVQTVEEDGEETAVITLPSIEALENSFKYSTIKIVKVEIKQGNNQPKVYEGDELANLDPEMTFTEDGYVKYTVRYANTEAFQAESIVHVVLMPKTKVERNDNLLTLTASNNATLKYALVYGNAKKDIKRRATEIPNDEWKPTNGSMVFDNLESLKEEGVTAIFYKTEKDLKDNENIASSSVPTNSILSNEGIEVLAVQPVHLYMGESVITPFKTDSHNYNFDGIISFNNPNLEQGRDFTVTVTPKNNAEGWTSTDATGNELASAYQNAFKSIQGNDASGLYNQYIGLETEYVDGFFTSVSNVNVTPVSNNEESFSVSADIPCSGVYVITVSPVEGSEFSFTEGSVEITVYPNLQGTFGTDKGFNIAGFTFGDTSDNGGFYTISFPTDYDDFGKNMLCYIPGTYFANGLTASSTGYVTPETSSNNDSYFASVDLEKMNTSDSANVYITISKNGASHQYEFVVNKLGNINESTDVESIEAEDGEAEYYDLNGFKVSADRLDRGIYIKVQNGKATKVMR